MNIKLNCILKYFEWQNGQNLSDKNKCFWLRKLTLLSLQIWTPSKLFLLTTCKVKFAIYIFYDIKCLKYLNFFVVPWHPHAGILRMVVTSASNLKCPRVKGNWIMISYMNYVIVILLFHEFIILKEKSIPIVKWAWVLKSIKL